MKFVALIPARGGSKRIPRKNLEKVGGLTLVERAIACTRAVLMVERVCPEVYVSTEDSEIADVARAAGALVIDRPPELAQDDTRMEAVVDHFLDVVPLEHGDCVILLEPTATLRTFWDILTIAALMRDCQAARIVHARRDGCHGFLYADSGLASAFQVGPYAWYPRDERCLFPEGTRLINIGDDRAVDIDTPEDLERARALA